MNTFITSKRARTAGLSLVVACAAALPLQAADRTEPAGKASKQENIGVTTGFTVGAVAGGPLGAILGATAGAWLGDRYHKQSEARTELAADLNNSETERAKLAQNLVSLNGTLVEARTYGEQLGKALDRTRDLEMTVGFRTGDTTLTPDAVTRLERLGTLAGAMPGAKIRIAGYADPRGPEALNAALSKSRAESVAQVLTGAGIRGEQLIIESYGESVSSAAEGDIDGYAFDRRVTVRIEHGGAQAVAQAR